MSGILPRTAMGAGRRSRTPPTLLAAGRSWRAQPKRFASNPAVTRREEEEEYPDPAQTKGNASIPNPLAPFMLSSYIEAPSERDKFKRRFRRNIYEMFLWMALGSLALKTKWQRMETEELLGAARLQARSLMDEIERLEAELDGRSVKDLDSGDKGAAPIVAPRIVARATAGEVGAAPAPDEAAAADADVVDHVVVTDEGLVDKETKKPLGSLM
ncbi:hypothetical protein DFJ74DRAFT_657935 [Hyaloraphidium curvatum]|nr:hypothetical protein DFJ74DRAFT_657935 [Hyaloraphidium curvatum]